MIDGIEITSDGQIMPDLPWLNDLRKSVEQHPGNQLILDAIGDFGKNLSQGQKSKLDMFLKTIQKGEANMGVAQHTEGDENNKIENRLRKSSNGYNSLGEGDESNYLLTPQMNS